MDLFDGALERRGSGGQAHGFEAAEPVGVEVGRRLHVKRSLPPHAAERGQLARVVRASTPHDDNRLDLSGYRVSMAITAALVAAGGAIGFAGIRNRTRE